MEPIERDLIVSLGSNCATAYNLRHFYGIERTGLFDWMITPVSCLPNLIRKRFALVDGDFRDDLVRVELPAKDSILHAPTGIILHHAFARDKRDRISWKWRFEARSVANKFKFLGERMNRWMSEASHPALFINGDGFHEALSPDAVKQIGDPDVYTRIIDEMRETYPGADPLFCIVNGHGEAVDRVRHRPDVRVVTVGNRGDWHEGFEGHFAGCETAWREALTPLRIRPSLVVDHQHVEPLRGVYRRI